MLNDTFLSTGVVLPGDGHLLGRPVGRSDGTAIEVAGPSGPGHEHLVHEERVHGTVTFAVRLEARTVNEAVPPPSVVTRPLVGVTTRPAVSTSTLVADTDLEARRHRTSVLPVGPTVMV
jgi:hypothetical protein